MKVKIKSALFQKHDSSPPVLPDHRTGVHHVILPIRRTHKCPRCRQIRSRTDSVETVEI